MHHLHRAVVLLAATAVLTACASPDDWSRPRPVPPPIGVLGPGFTDPSAPPTPEAVVTPSPGSWSAVRPPAGYRVVLLTTPAGAATAPAAGAATDTDAAPAAGADAASADDADVTSADDADAPTAALAEAVREWASAEDVSLKTVTADVTKPVDAIVDAMELRPDLIVSAGDALIEPLALVSPSHLDQQFLVMGARIPEPTVNVTAVDWTGTPSAASPQSFTPDRCAAAIRAGTAAVLHDLTGIVLWLAP
ncbi:hypothetical protein [Actinoplanes sp. G11-F43]|uniref:hypothetical protein n=1 Tax=Actinoplanes sp. G11-F43 TaxID=3424130 RepID=UPI003D345312